MATLKPTTPLLASNKGALKPASPLHPKIAPKTPISHPQRRCRFQSRLGRHPQRRWRFQTRLGRRPQRRWRFQTSGPAGLQGQAAAPMGGGGAWPGFETTRRAKLAARAARGRAAAHGHTKQPGPAGHAQQPAPAGGRGLRRPEHQRRNMPPRHNKTARPHWGRAAQSVSKAQRRITTMSGSPRPLSWRTLEIPSLEATSFAVPSMRGSS